MTAACPCIAATISGVRPVCSSWVTAAHAPFPLPASMSAATMSTLPCAAAQCSAVALRVAVHDTPCWRWPTVRCNALPRSRAGRGIGAVGGSQKTKESRAARAPAILRLVQAAKGREVVAQQHANERQVRCLHRLAQRGCADPPFHRRLHGGREAWTVRRTFSSYLLIASRASWMLAPAHQVIFKHSQTRARKSGPPARNTPSSACSSPPNTLPSTMVSSLSRALLAPQPPPR